jgi:phenylacetate-CoA ligase
MKNYSLKDILENAQANSDFYKKSWNNNKSLLLQELPITNQEEFWSSKILSQDKVNGIVFKSGGSSGAPKYSYFTHEEWITFTKHFGQGMSKGILDNGDRVANLFYVGDLYASFLFIKDSLQWIENIQITQFPIAGSVDPKVILKTCEEFGINVLCGVPSQLLKLLEFLFEHKTDFPDVHIEKVLFGGESLYPDQEMALKKFFPELQISSIGYASVDGGLLGYSSKDCQNGEHRSFDEATVIEIVDPDTNEIIHEEGRVGKVLLTNLTRMLMPIIRYPAGDLAMWVEKEGTPDRKFKLQGRSDEGARLGTITVYFEDTRKMILEALKEFQGIQFQMLLDHFDHKDCLTLKISGHHLKASPELIQRVINGFSKEKKVYVDVLSKNLIHPLRVEITDVSNLESNQRTGKLKRVIDKRFN